MEKLREWLALTSKTPGELGDAIGVSDQTVRNWVAERSYPGGLTLRKLSEYTHIPVEDLVPRDVA